MKFQNDTTLNVTKTLGDVIRDTMIIMMVMGIVHGSGDGGCGSDETCLLQTQVVETSDPFEWRVRVPLHVAVCCYVTGFCCIIQTADPIWMAGISQYT